MCSFQGAAGAAATSEEESEKRAETDEAETRQYSGDNGERDPPVPIPNTEVKPFSADGTWLETARESRSLPDYNEKKLSMCRASFLLRSEHRS